MPQNPPAPIAVDDDVFRRDIDSDEMRSVHPDLPNSPKKRILHQHLCDLQAYERIRSKYPMLRPPWSKRVELESSD